MKTLLDIPDDLMSELLKETNIPVKKEAVVLAIRSFLDAKRRERLASLVGNYEFTQNLDDLDRMRLDG